MDLDESLQTTNTELRFLTLELMKIADKKGLTFKEIAIQYVNNVHLMQKLIDESLDSSSHLNKPKSTSD